MAIGGALFLVGACGLIAIVAARFVEEKRSIRFFDSARTRLDAVTRRAYRLAVFGELPTEYRAWLSAKISAFTHHIVVLLVSLLRAIERPLSRMSHRLRVSRAKHDASREPSSFLKRIQKKNPAPLTEEARGEVPPHQV